MNTHRNLITREIGIDMGHRVTNHGSKCKNLHGHRYTIQATLIGDLVEGGEQEGMVMDFGFLKDLMMREIDEPCDHGLCLWVMDPLLSVMVPGEIYRINTQFNDHPGVTGYSIPDSPVGKLYVTRAVPTAENLARHWWDRLSGAVEKDSRNVFESLVHSIRVWETPNCSAEYSPYF